jgi:hypothetical protein
MSKNISVPRRFWLPILLVVWNIFDAGVHVAIDKAEPLRIAGNVIAIAAAYFVARNHVKTGSVRLLVGVAFAVVVLNSIHISLHGSAIPMFVFIGVAVALLLVWAKTLLRHRKSNEFA